jgi:hypothetical protein
MFGMVHFGEPGSSSAEIRPCSTVAVVAGLGR